MAKSSWGYDLNMIDRSVRPQDDFYHYANGAWLKNNDIPANESRWGLFSVLHKKTQTQLRGIVTELASRTHVAEGTIEQQIRDFYRSGMDTKRRDALGATPLASYRKKIQSIKTSRDLEKVIAELHRLGLGGPFGMGFDTDYKNCDRYVLYLGQSGLGMPDRDYYLLDAPEQKRVRDAYVLHIVAMLRLAGYSKIEAESRRDVVMNIETALAKVSMTKEDLRDADKIYNKYSLAKLSKLVPSVDWTAYFKAQGAEPKEVIVCQPDYFIEVDRLLTELTLEEWQVYLEWHLINDFAGYLSTPFIRQLFSFYSKTLAGTKTMKPLWRRTMNVVSGYLGEGVGQLYVQKHFPEEARRKVNELVDDLIEAYEARLRALPWMTPATKKRALQKLHAMNRKLGYPDKWKTYKGLVVKENDFFGNVLRAGEYEHRRTMRKLNKPVDRSEWYDVPQTVNAFYAPNLNDMLFPAAFLQMPFFGLNVDDALNYGSMGSVIGHEITHGFDDEGSKFDKRGNLKSWWSKEDRAKFMRRASVVRDQYNKYEVAPGINVNGQLTLGENIADLGGLSIAFDAYMRRLEKTGRKDIDGYTPEQRFFLSFALFDAENCRPEVLKLRVLNDTHSPPTCRINGVVSNLPEFYKAWDVKKGDKLFREPKDRAKIW